MAAESVGSDKAELKRWLKRASSEPIHMAFAMGGDGKAVIKLDKMKQPRALEKHLKDGLPDAKNHRFGTVTIDPDDPKIVKFVVNKAVGGAARKLVIALKGTGFSKIQIVMDDGSAVEEAQGDDGDDEDEDSDDTGTAAKASGAEDDDDDATSSDDDPSPAVAPNDGDAAATAALDATPEAGAPAAPASDGALDAGAAGTPDAATLTGQLTAAVKQMMGVIQKNPSQKAALAQLATDAQASLKRGDLDQAAAGISILQQAIDGASDAGPAATGAPAVTPPPSANGAAPADPAVAQKLKKSQALWSATRSKIEADLQKLGKALADAAKGDEGAEDMEQQLLSGVEPVLSTLDESLSETLAQAAAATDDAVRQQLMQQAQATVDRYQKFIGSNDLIGHLDSNPFVQLAITKTLTATLQALSAAVR